MENQNNSELLYVNYSMRQKYAFLIGAIIFSCILVIISLYDPFFMKIFYVSIVGIIIAVTDLLYARKRVPISIKIIGDEILCTWWGDKTIKWHMSEVKNIGSYSAFSTFPYYISFASGKEIRVSAKYSETKELFEEIQKNNPGCKSSLQFK